MSTKQLSEEAMKQAGWDISSCGLNCAKCDVKKRGECEGCRGNPDKHWSPQCEFRPCAEAKGLRYCFQCDEFPCKKIQAFAEDGYDHHRIAVENMKEMKKIGLQKWIEKQPKVMFCPGWII